MREPNGTDGTWLTSFALVVSGFWFGYTTRHSVADAIGRLDAVKESVSPYDQQVAEMHDDIMRGLDNRLAFEAWADERQ